MTTVLTTLGIGEDCERLYRHVLRHDRQLIEDHAHRLGWDLDRVIEAVRPLLELRLVRQDPESALAASPPRTALTRLVDRENSRLDLRRRELEDVAAAVGDFSADHLAGRVDVLDPAAMKMIPVELVPVTVAELLRTTIGPIRSMHFEVAQGPAVDVNVSELTAAVIEDGRSLRSVYPVTVLDCPEHLEWVREWARRGEQQRIIQRVPGEYVIFGDEVVMSAQTWGGASSSAVLMRLPVLVGAFTEMFDNAWASGLPVPDAQVEQDADIRLLALLAAGFKDEAIARYLGLGVRTVRRRIAALMDHFNVQTRYQLGVVAERRGLLGQGSASGTHPRRTYPTQFASLTASR